MDSELEIAIEFAVVEISELKAGVRDLGSCPGLQTLAEAILGKPDAQ